MFDVGCECVDVVCVGGDDVFGMFLWDDFELVGVCVDVGRDGVFVFVEIFFGEFCCEGVEIDVMGVMGEGGGGGEDYDARRGVGRVGRAARGEVERRRDVC